ncbi:MAG: CHAT domain-containing tetratricopeptide repeat protein [Thermodesulfobacteriota bacterium]
MKRLAFLVAILWIWVALPPATAPAQSKEEAMRLYNEAYKLDVNPKSRDDLVKAVEKYEQAMKIFERLGDHKRVGMCANNGGMVLKALGQYRKAQEYYEKSLAIKRKLGDLKGEGMTLGNLGNVFYHRGDYDRALELYEKSLAIRRKLGDTAGEGLAIMGMAAVFARRGNYDRSLELFEKSLAISRRLGDMARHGLLLNNIGELHRHLGAYDQSLELFEKSLTISRKLGNVAGEGLTLGNMATVYNSRGNYHRAVELYEQSLAISRKLGDTADEGHTLNRMAIMFKDRGNYDRALELHEQSLAIKRKLGDAAGEEWALMGIGRIHQAAKRFAEAIDCFEKALAIYSRIGVSKKANKNDIGNLYLDQGDLARAEPLIKEAGYDSSLGRLALMKADYQEALKRYQRLLHVQLKSRNADLLFAAYTGLGTAYERLGKDNEAAEQYRKAVEHIEEVRLSIAQADRETFFNVTVGGFSRTAPYEGLARVLLRLKKPLEAMKTSEFTKARVYGEAISKRHEHAGRDVPHDIRKKDEQLIDQLAALSKNLQDAYAKENKQAIATIEPQVREARAQLAAHVEKLRREYPLFAATRYPQPMDLAQTALRADEWALSYDVTDPGLIIYLTRGKELKKALFKPVTRQDLEAMVRTVREPVDVKAGEDMGDKIRTFDFAAGKKLADVLLADVLPELPKDAAVIIVPADCLGVLPFEMLVLNTGGKIVTDKRLPQTVGVEFFGDRNPVSYYQSITALTLARNFGKATSAGSRTMVMCDPVFSPDDPRVAQARRAELKAALSTLTSDVLMSAMKQQDITWPRLDRTRQLGDAMKTADPGATDLCEGFQACKAAFTGKDLTPYRNIVFATHGYAGMDIGGLLEPVLVLTLVNQPKGQDGFLRMSEVMGLKLGADVVALTACQSGLGKRISGEGTVGMGRAFQYAGAKASLMSLWTVAEKSSVELTEAFFRNLKAGRPKLEALKLARDEIRKAGYDHPFFWAPFILVGEVN